MRLQERLRAHYARVHREAGAVVPPGADGRHGLDLVHHLLRAALAEPKTVRGRKLIALARATTEKSVSESGEFVRRQVRARVLELLERYRAHDEAHRGLIETLDLLSLWEPEDVARLARLAGSTDDHKGEYAYEALQLVLENPERLPELVEAIRATRTLSDEQRALLVITSPITARDAQALLWSMATTYAEYPDPRELPLFDEKDILHIAVETLMDAYLNAHAEVEKAVNQVWRAHRQSADKTRARRRYEFLDLFGEGHLFEEPKKPARQIRRELNVIHLEFGCQTDFEIK